MRHPCRGLAASAATSVGPCGTGGGLRGIGQLELAGAAATTTRHLSYLETGRSRPSQDMVDRWPSPGRVVCPHFRLDGSIVRTITVAARFESTTDVTLDELRIELIYPQDNDDDRFVHERAALAR